MRWGGAVAWAWIAWALVWLAGAFSTKRTERREPLGSRLTYVLTAAAAGVLIGWPRAPWSELMSLPLWPRSALPFWIGVAVLYGGLAFAVWARVHLGRNWSGAVTVKEGHELIRTGPYAYVRHPIYTGILAGVLGTAITDGTMRAACAVAIIAVAFIVKLLAEERFMRETFPGQYQSYSEQVPALVPFVKPRRSARS